MTIKITDLPASGELTPEDYLPIASLGNNHKTTIAAIALSFHGATVATTAQASRIFNIDYQNQTGGFLFVSVVFQRTATGTLFGYVGTRPLSSRPVTSIEAAFSSSSPLYQTIFFMVPPGAFYRVYTDTSGTQINWFETIVEAF